MREKLRIVLSSGSLLNYADDVAEYLESHVKGKVGQHGFVTNINEIINISALAVQSNSLTAEVVVDVVYDGRIIRPIFGDFVPGCRIRSVKDAGILLTKVIEGFEIMHIFIQSDENTNFDEYVSMLERGQTVDVMVLRSNIKRGASNITVIAPHIL